MILECDDKIVSGQAKPADIDLALAAGPRGESWYVNLSAAPDIYIEAKLEAKSDAKPGGALGFTVEYEDHGGLCRAASAIDEALLRRLLASYLAGDGQWKELCAWTVERKGQRVSPAAAPAPGPRPGFLSGPDGRPLPLPVVIIGIGLFATLTLLPVIPESWLPLFLLPSFMREKAALPVALIFLAMPTLVITLLIWKLLEARRAARWPQAAGRIVKSTVEAKHVAHRDEASTLENLPAIAYEFAVAGKAYRGTRINLDEIQDPADLEATLARYPVGANVIVHYDPKDPEICVLERDFPKDLGKGCAAAIACVAVIGGMIYAGYENFGRLEAALPAKANAKLMVFSGLFGLVALMLFRAARRTSEAAAAWPKTTGKVMTSTVESYLHTIDGRSSTVYQPAVEYAYEVHGREFRSRQITLNSKSGGSRAFAEKAAAQYPVGKVVELHYDPKNPSQAALRPDSFHNWIILAIALFAFAVAAYAAGIFQ
jgi:hypothetical protein